MENANQAAEVNNVRLPENVIYELKRLGRALESYSIGELQSAAQACVMDGRLIDDPNGANFLDQLELTEAERRKAAGINECAENEEEDEKSCTHTKKYGHKLKSFCKRLMESRAKKEMEENGLLTN